MRVKIDEKRNRKAIPTAAIHSRLKDILLLVFLSAALAALAAYHQPTRLESDYQFLSDASLNGRVAPSRGLDNAALYIQAQLRAAGWQPGVDGGYLQSYRLMHFSPERAKIRVVWNGEELGVSDCSIVPRGLVPNRNHGPFKAVLAGGPAPNPAECAGKAVFFPMPHGATEEVAAAAIMERWAEVRAGNGSCCAFVAERLDGPEPSPGAETIRRIAARRQTYLVDAPSLSGPPILLISAEAFGRTAGGPNGYSFKQWRRDAERGDFQPVSLDAELTIEIGCCAVEGRASNVVARLPGYGGPEEEWVVIAARFGAPAPGGENGSRENTDPAAAAAAELLEAARRLAEAPPTRRGVLALFTGGGVLADLGAIHHARHPAAPRGKTALIIQANESGAPVCPFGGLLRECETASRNRLPAFARFGGACPDNGSTFSPCVHAGGGGVPVLHWMRDHSERDESGPGALGDAAAAIAGLAAHFANVGGRPVSIVGQ